jgi:hypothetical protein
MDASGTIAREQEIEFNALEGSLSMMSKGSVHHLAFFLVFLIVYDSFKRCSGLVRNLMDLQKPCTLSSPFLIPATEWTAGSLNLHVGSVSHP